MITFASILASMSLCLLISSLNPVKLSFVLSILSITLFTILMISNSGIWMSSIFFMIFIGGIMVMFMILSSLLPNEKNIKTKKVLVYTLATTIIFSSVFSNNFQMESMFNHASKLMFLSNQSFEMLMMVILMYFLAFIFIVSKDTSSLRSFYCWKKKDFVNL